MPKLSFMKWFPLDWLRDTRVLSLDAKGVWIDILCMAWNEPERGCYTRSKIDFCRELQIPQKRYVKVLAEIAKVGTVTFRNDLVTVMSRRMAKQEKHYKDNALRQARFRSNAKVTKAVTDKTLDVRRSQDVLNSPKDYGKGLPEFVLEWQRREDRASYAAEIAMGLKAYKLGFRMEEDLYKKIMGDETNGTVRSKSISEQVAERRRTQGIEKLRDESPAGKILERIGNLPKVQPET